MVRLLLQLLAALLLFGGAFVLTAGLHFRARMIEADAPEQALSPAQEIVFRARESLRDRCSFALHHILVDSGVRGYGAYRVTFWASYPIVCNTTPEDVIDRAYFVGAPLNGWGKGTVYEKIAPRVMSDLSEAEFECVMRNAESPRNDCGPDKQPGSTPP